MRGASPVLLKVVLFHKVGVADLSDDCCAREFDMLS